MCVVGVGGNVHAAGDTDHEFSIIRRGRYCPFAVRICQQMGAEQAAREVGANATGMPFRSQLAAFERSADGRANPMVQCRRDRYQQSLECRATLSRLSGQFIHDGLSRFAGPPKASAQ